ncbi:hypothetical protein [Fodinibius halophilus]|uniref:DUF3649 domain-containing protein n=1 Tax=Fodinibius halophilus TaxID=1736908 RepID=A0A6M1T3W3_9BACT|nr:hypothetical protein [Fodinibius halophilus]NGP90106.1 hypothetical protein [Fodinibius halophilus]
MPANKRYLSTRAQRISKTLAGIVGGYFVTIAIHLLVGVIIGTGHGWVQTVTYSTFLFWIAAMVVALLFEKAWKVWALYLFITFSCAALIYLLR